MLLGATVGALFGLATALSAQTRAFTGFTLIDGNGGAPIPDAVLVVRDGRVLAAGPRLRTDVPRTRNASPLGPAPT
jgi:hypothetical protein